MKEAFDWTNDFTNHQFASSEGVRPFLHNLILQVQADAFAHAAGLADEALRCVDVKGPGLLLRETARRIWPGAPAPEVSPPLIQELAGQSTAGSPPTEVSGSDQGA
jgi:hypothetical protein